MEIARLSRPRSLEGEEGPHSSRILSLGDRFPGTTMGPHLFHGHLHPGATISHLVTQLPPACSPSLGLYLFWTGHTRGVVQVVISGAGLCRLLGVMLSSASTL